MSEEQRGTDGLKVREIIDATSKVLARGQLGPGWPRFERAFVAVDQKGEDDLFYEVMPEQILERINRKDIAKAIVHYWGKSSLTNHMSLSARNAEEAAAMFAYRAPVLTADVSAVRFKSEKGYTFYRLPFDPKEGPSPVFDELMSRTSNSRAVMAFIGSLFDPIADKQQYLWLYGTGGNGKSRLAEFLRWLLGKAAASTVVPHQTNPNQFWTCQLLNKRLVVFSDTDNYNFINGAFFKGLCGGDSVRYEIKGGAIFDSPATYKFLFLSNQRPNIEDESSATRRAIYAEIQPVPQERRISQIAYDTLLKDEAAAIVHKCLKTYNELCPTHGEIMSLEGILADIIEESEERWATIAERWFHLWPLEYFEGVNYNSRPKLAPIKMQEVVTAEKLSSIQERKFKAYLERRFGVHKRSVKIGEHSSRYYINCTLKSDNKTYSNLSVVPKKEADGLLEVVRGCQKEDENVPSWFPVKV